MTKKGKISVGIGIAVVTILAFTANYVRKQINLLKDTDFELYSTKINELSFRNITITLWWNIVNKSDIGVIINDQIYDIYINGVFIKKIGYGSEVKVNPRSGTQIPTYINFSTQELIDVVKNSGGNMTSLLSKEGRENTELEIRGYLELKTSIFQIKKMPIEWKSDIQSLMN